MLHTFSCVEHVEYLNTNNIIILKFFDLSRVEMSQNIFRHRLVAKTTTS